MELSKVEKSLLTNLNRNQKAKEEASIVMLVETEVVSIETTTQEIVTNIFLNIQRKKPSHCEGFLFIKGLQMFCKDLVRQ